MSEVMTLLKEMRGRLGMYVGATSIVRLAAFLRGYELAMERFGGGAVDPFLPEFRDWIHRRFQSSQHSWEDTVLLHSADEGDAVKRFWELLDEFVKEHQGLPMIQPHDGNGSGRASTTVSQEVKSGAKQQ